MTKSELNRHFPINTGQGKGLSSKNQPLGSMRVPHLNPEQGSFNLVEDMSSNAKILARVALATGLFAAIHSLLASRKAKETATRLLGERKRNAFYRPFYNAQAVITSGALGYYIYKLPNRELYTVKGPAAWMMQGLRVGFLALGVAAAREVGFAGLTGWSGLKACLLGRTTIPREPEAQGPSPAPGGNLNVGGPFHFSRHPLNFIGVPILWLAPRMSLKLAMFNTLATLYFWAGSLHEEYRLRQAYGEAYREYEKSKVPFFVPGTKKKQVARKSLELNQSATNPAS